MSVDIYHGFVTSTITAGQRWWVKAVPLI